MKFYNRENELAELKRIQRLSFEENSRLTVITGRRRIGKTSLIMKAVDEMPTVYLFMKLLSVVSLSAHFGRFEYLCTSRDTVFQFIISIYDGNSGTKGIQSGYR